MTYEFVAGQYDPASAEWFVFGVLYFDDESSRIILDYGPFTSKREAEECAADADAIQMLALDTKAVNVYQGDKKAPGPFTVIDGGQA